MGHILVFIHHKQCEIMQIRSVNGNLLDLFDQSLLLDMIFLGTPQLCGGVYNIQIILFCETSYSIYICTVTLKMDPAAPSKQSIVSYGPSRILGRRIVLFYNPDFNQFSCFLYCSVNWTK